MAHIFYPDVNSKWSPVALLDPAYDLRNFPPHAGSFDPAANHDPPTVLVRIGTGTNEAWAVLAGRGGDVYVNGQPILAGLAVLSDRDLLLVRGRSPLFFSAETLATVQELPLTERPIFCGRCRQPMSEGTASVRCPGCGVFYDQTPDLPCWTYAEKCAFCGHTTALDAEFEWTPEE